MKLMFVCTANTCRSAMAEAIFKEIYDGDIEICSAGLNATTGKPASRNSIKACSKYGIDLSNHTATNILNSNIEEMDLVLTATEYHKYRLEGRYPHLKIYTIKEYIEERPYDIKDPHDKSLEDYESCFREIYKALDKLRLWI